MMTFSTQRFVPGLFALLASVLMTGPVLAQGKTSNTLWSTPDPVVSPGVSGDTVQIDMLPIDKARAFLGAKLQTFAKDGAMTARINDISSYSDDTVRGLEDILSEGGDPCTQAVRAALYLDGHLEEADWSQIAKGVERPVELIMKTLSTFLVPDLPGQDSLAVTLLKKIESVDAALKVYKVYSDVQDHYAQTALVRRGIAANEIVQQAQTNGWAEWEIAKKRAELQEQALFAAEEMVNVQSRIEQAFAEVDRRYEKALIDADLDMKAARDAIREKYGLVGGNLEDLSWLETELRRLELDREAKRVAAGSRRAAEYQQAMKSSYAAMEKAQFAAERILDQSDALARYAAPLARGDCAFISRDGPIAEPSKTDPVGAVLKLQHDKLLIFLGSIGQRPSDDLLNCVCYMAGYGSSSTHQYYHPDTLGTYDKRYTCQQPGPPCVVEGFGCSRHPLPQDIEIWRSCGESKGDDIEGAILKAVAARRAQK